MHKSGYKLVDEAMYYHTTKVKPSWSTSPKLKFVKKIGNHRFYKRIET